MMGGLAGQKKAHTESKLFFLRGNYDAHNNTLLSLEGQLGVQYLAQQYFEICTRGN